MHTERLAKSLLKENESIVDLVWGGGPQAPADFFDSALGGLLDNMGQSEPRPASTFQGRMRQAASRAAKQEREAVAQTAPARPPVAASPVTKANAQTLIDHLDFLEAQHVNGLLDAADYAELREETETELFNISQES